MVWYFCLLKNFSQFAVIHTVKGFSIVDKTEVDIFLEFPGFLFNPTDVANLISGSSAFSKTSLNIRKFMVHVLPSPISLVKTRPGSDFSSYHELLIAKFRLKLKKVGKTTVSFSKT